MCGVCTIGFQTVMGWVVVMLSRTYATMVLLFFVVSVANNYSFNYNIPVPLHIIFRSVCVCALTALFFCILSLFLSFSYFCIVAKYYFWVYDWFLCFLDIVDLCQKGFLSCQTVLLHEIVKGFFCHPCLLSLWQMDWLLTKSRNKVLTIFVKLVSSLLNR